MSPAVIPSSSKDAFDKSVASKTTAFKCLPENIYLVVDPSHPSLGHLFGARALESPDPTLVASIDEYGVRQAINIVKAPALVKGCKEPTPGLPVCEVGRRRVVAAREVNRQRKLAAKKEGREIDDSELVWVKCLYDSDKEGGLDIQIATLIVENMAHKEENILIQAEQCARLLRNNGGDKHGAARVFHRSLSTIENLLRVNGLPEAAKEAIRKDLITYSGAIELCGLSEEECHAKLNELTKGGTRKATVGEARRASGKLKSPPHKELTEKLEAISERIGAPHRKAMASFNWNNTEQASGEFLAGLLYGARWARGVK